MGNGRGKLKDDNMTVESHKEKLLDNFRKEIQKASNLLREYYVKKHSRRSMIIQSRWLQRPLWILEYSFLAMGFRSHLLYQGPHQTHLHNYLEGVPGE
jgi:hypothetical protein